MERSRFQQEHQNCRKLLEIEQQNFKDLKIKFQSLGQKSEDDKAEYPSWQHDWKARVSELEFKLTVYEGSCLKAKREAEQQSEEACSLRQEKHYYEQLALTRKARSRISARRRP